jgi:hypothetical protein
MEEKNCIHDGIWACNTNVKNGLACKEKWATIYGDYKRIQDYMGVMRQNDHFWSMFATNKLAYLSPVLFNKNIFKIIDSFMSNQPIFQPPHSRDFMDQTITSTFPNLLAMNLKFLCTIMTPQRKMISIHSFIAVHNQDT